MMFTDEAKEEVLWEGESCFPRAEGTVWSPSSRALLTVLSLDLRGARGLDVHQRSPRSATPWQGR